MKHIYEKFLRALAKVQVKHPYLTLALIVMITLIFFVGSTKVKTVASLEQMMPTDIEEIKAFNTLRDNNMGQDMIAIVLQLDKESTQEEGITSITDKRVMEYIEYLSHSIASEVDIGLVHAPSDPVLFVMRQQGVNSLRDASPQMYEAILEDQRIDRMLEQFINHDKTTAIIIATTDISAHDERMKLLAQTIQENLDTAGHPPGVKVSVTGTPIIQQKLGELISSDRSSTQNISTLFVFIITMLLFGTFTSALVPITIVTISVTWLYGIMGFTSLPISTLAGGVAAMVIGIGIDYAIHMMNKFKNERKQGYSVEQAMINATGQTGMALTGAAIATVLAFLAFLLGDMPEMNRFGMLMAIGVSCAFFLSLFGLPAMLIIEEKIIHKLRKHLRFGIEGEFALYSKDEIHPDQYEVVDVSQKDLKSILKDHKVCKVKANGGKTARGELQ